MQELRDLLQYRRFQVLGERSGAAGDELVVRSPEGRVIILCAASENPLRDVHTLESLLYGEPEPGPILGYDTARPGSEHGVLSARPASN